MQKNTAGSIASKLSAEVALVQAVTGPLVGLQLQNTTSMIAALVIAFYSSWQLSLVIIGAMPLLMAASTATSKWMMSECRACGATQ